MVVEVVVAGGNAGEGEIVALLAFCRVAFGKVAGKRPVVRVGGDELEAGWRTQAAGFMESVRAFRLYP